MYDDDEHIDGYSPKVVEFYDYILRRARQGCRAVKFDQIMHMKFYIDEMLRNEYPIAFIESAVDTFRDQLYED